MDDAKQLAYRQPELFIAGALAVGFALGRFFKSSRRPARSGQDNYQNDYSYGYNQYGSNQFGYDEYDPRDTSRSYGEPYGQRYGDQFSRGRGPESSTDYDAGYRGGYEGNYGRSYSSGYGQPSQNRSQSSSQQYGQGSNDQWSDQWRRNPNESQSQGYNQSGRGNTQQSGSQQSGNQQFSGQQSGSQQSGSTSQRVGPATGEVTTHGLGSGQSVQRDQEIHGQEFGQGEEQVSNYRRNEPKQGNPSSSGPNQREEGDLK